MEPDLTSLLFDKNMESFMLKAGLKSEIIFILMDMTTLQKCCNISFFIFNSINQQCIGRISSLLFLSLSRLMMPKFWQQNVYQVKRLARNVYDKLNCCTLVCIITLNLPLALLLQYLSPLYV